jgi:hypothetical protein
LLFTICYATTKAMINKPHDGCKKRCHRLGFVSVLTHGPQLDIDVLTVYNASARLVHHIITIQKYLVGLISDILIILLKLTIHLFFILFFFNLPMCTPWRDSVYAATPLLKSHRWSICNMASHWDVPVASFLSEFSYIASYVWSNWLIGV